MEHEAERFEATGPQSYGIYTSVTPIFIHEIIFLLLKKICFIWAFHPLFYYEGKKKKAEDPIAHCIAKAF